MTGDLKRLIYLVFVLVFLGLVARNGGLLLLAIPLLIYIAAARLFSPEEPHLQASRSIGANLISQEKPVTIQINVTNQGSDLAELYLEDPVSPGFKILSGQAHRLVSLPSGKSVELEYTLKGKRGLYRFGGIRVRAGDHFGLFTVHRFLSLPGQLLIMPQVLRLKRIEIRPRQTRGFAGPIPARQPGSGTDFFGVREYQLGDSLRRINWRVAARHAQDLFTNEFEQERIADVGLILDARKRINIQSSGGDLFDHAVTATASLADAFLKDGHRVGLLIYGYSLERVFPGYGKFQRERILRSLAKAETGMNYALESLKNLPTRLFPAHSQLVLVSPLVPDDLQVLTRFRAYGYEILVISPDAVQFEADARGFDLNREFPARLARIERALLLRRLKQAGIQVVDWHIDHPLDQLIQAVSKHHSARRRVLEAAP